MKTNQGSVVIYTVLLMFVMMTSAAIVLSIILTRHIRASENYLATEQAFAAANSSIEIMLYAISKQGNPPKTEVGDKGTGSITYVSGVNAVQVDYKGEGCGVVDSKFGLVPNLTASGVYKGIVRRIDLGEGATEGCKKAP